MGQRTWRRRAGAAALCLALAGGASACGSDSASSAERAKADALQAKLAPVDLEGDVDTDTLISLYGTDGGKVCEIASDPAAMEREGLLAHPRFALRKTEVDPDAVAYTKAVVEVYCPDQLGNVEDYIEGLRVDDEN